MKRYCSGIPFLLIGLSAGFLPTPLCLSGYAQVDKIVIGVGTPEDQALTAIANEQDAQKKLAMYEDFVQKFSSNPADVSYGNWQISQSYQAAGDLQKALAYGDKALAGSPRNLDMLVTQASIAQQLKDNTKVIDYSVRGGEIYNSLSQTKPEGGDEQELAAREEEKNTVKRSHEYLEVAAYNAVTSEPDARQRMADIERFTAAFPDSRFQEPLTSYAMMALSELKDKARLIAYGEKVLAGNPSSLPALLLLAGTYVDDPKPGSVAKAVSYAQRAVEAAKADAPDADRARKVSAGAAHSTLGYALMKEDKTAGAIPELKSASALLRGQDDQQYEIAMYRLGFAYAKLSKVSEARDVLNEIVKMPDPVQKPAQDLLIKVNAARAQGR